MKPSKCLWALMRPGRPVGTKEVYLPNFVITLIRTPQQPPTQATFNVPLNFTKLDIRDYLYHVYNVRVGNIRSIVKQHPARYNRTLRFQGREVPDSVWGQRLWRPQSTKRMTVELEHPFVWPKEPKEEAEFEPWDKEGFDYAHKFRKEQAAKQEASIVPAKRTAIPNDMSDMASQARDLLQRKQTWQPTWQRLAAKK